jgi:hypothetical protein
VSPYPVPEAAGHIKGAPLRAFLAFLDAEVGRPKVEAAVRELAAGVLSPSLPSYGVLGATWYPLDVVGRLLDALLGVPTGVQLDTLAARTAEAVMKETLGGVHRAVFRAVGSPSLMRQFRMTFWRQQYDTGEVDIIDVHPQEQRHEYRQWAGHHPLICAITFACVPVMFRAMGTKNPRMKRLSCVSHGARVCSAQIRWDP